MKTRKKLYIAILSILLLSLTVFSIKIFAAGNVGGGGVGDYQTCSLANPRNACTIKKTINGREYGGYSWRYYETSSNSVWFYDLGDNTGGDVHVEKCGSVGGFWFLGFEVYGSDGKYLGFQAPRINKERASGNGWAVVSTKGNDTRTGPEKNMKPASRAHNGAEVKSKYIDARNIMINELGSEGAAEAAGWHEWDSSASDNLIWFCAKPETAAYAAKSQVSIAGGSSAQTPWSSKDVYGKTAIKHIKSGNSAQITFVHSIRKEGTGKPGNSHYSVSTNSGPTRGGDFNYDNDQEGTAHDVYRETITVDSGGKYCSVLTYDNKALNNRNKNVTSEVCAEITVSQTSQQTTDDLKEVTVLFSASSQVEANGEINAINESTGESFKIPKGEILGTSNNVADTFVNSFDPETITVIDDYIPLKFSHAVTRIDNETGVSTAHTYTILTPPSIGSLTANNVVQLAKEVFFSANTLTKLLSDKISNGNFTIGIDRSTKNKFKKFSGAAAEEAGELIKSSDYLENSLLKLTTSDLSIGQTDSGYSTSANYKAGDGEGRDYCQALVYQNTRIVYTDESIQKIKEKQSQSICHALNFLHLPGVDKFCDTLNAGLNWLISIINDDAEGAASAAEDFWSRATELVKHAATQAGNFINQLASGNAPVSAVCVRLKKAFDFNIDASPVADKDDVAIVGETLGLDANQSAILSYPLHSNTMTDTSPLTIRLVSFTANPAQADSLTGNFVSGQAHTGDSSGPCEYYRNKVGTTSCAQIGSDYTEKVVPRQAGDPFAKKKLSALGISSNLSATVPDVETGTLFCLAIGVKDADSDSKRNGSEFWAVSNATCRTVAKKPSLQVHDGSVYSAGKVETLLTNKIPSSSGGSKTLYGSWVEYGLIGKNAITGLASGAQLRNGSSKSKICDDSANPFDTLSPLTIANKGCALGKSEITVNSNILQRFNTLFTQAAQSQSADSTTPSFNLSSSGGSDTVIKNFTNHVLVSGTATVPHIIYGANGITISGDIAAGPNAPVILISDGDIIINNKVARVDAWLVAENNSVITCQYGIGDFSDESSSCGNRLSINGPVFAKGLKPYRAAGSGVGHSNSLVPAETFTLPASTYVWAYNYASSDKFYPAYQRELAPRY